MKIVCKIIIYLFLLLCSSCGYSNTNSSIVKCLPVATDTVFFDVLGQLKNGVISIDDTIDLKNKACLLPPKATLRFKGGCVKNGTLIGNETKIKTTKTCFNRVRIEGTWNVPTIKSSMFCDLSYDNALKDVVALSNPSINNKIVIEKGKYQVTAYNHRDVCIPVCSNTDIVINGDIILTPNDFRNYDIIKASGNNIKIHGNGVIIGDKHTHTGNKGEWGMGIDIDDAHHVNVSGLTIKDCWGDCIYVGGKSTDVLIKDCKIDHGRRQGVSITSADRVTIKNCSISNIGGTSPEYAIDVEPNEGETVDNVLIDRCRVSKCRGGIMTYGKAEGAHIGCVRLRNCDISEILFHAPLTFRSTDYVSIEGCNIDIQIIKFIFRFQNINRVLVKNNRITAKRFLLEPCSNLTLSKNIIQCGGFYTEPENKEIYRNVLIKDNYFMENMPNMGEANSTFNIRIKGNTLRN